MNGNKQVKRMPTSRVLSGLLGISTILLIVCCSIVKGTTIVVARTANEIVIGVDSKVTDAYGNEIKNGVCKIQQVGNLFVAFEGLLRDKKTSFSVPEIATRALKSTADASAAERGAF